MKFAIVTFGCRVNQADSLAIEDGLRRRGGTPAPADQADVVVVNTCSVTAGADQGARQTIRRIARSNPHADIVVTGCYASRRPEEVQDLPNVSRVIANADKDALTDLLATAFPDGGCGRALEPGAAGRTALSLRVQTGCDEACSYCIIPSTRGAGRSMAIADVMTDIARAISAGYKEIWITGVHLGSFGRDRADGATLLALLEALAAVADDVLFRVSSLEPMDCTREIVDVFTRSPRLAPHFHLPLQHGHDEMLSAMRRPYSASYYTDLVFHIAERLPHAAIGSDVIVGFPGERDHHFRELVAVLESLPLAYLHVFPYSERPGTAAAVLPDAVDGTVVRARGAAIRQIAAAKAHAFRRANARTTRRALTVDDGRTAVTDNYLKVPLEHARPRNTWVDVTIDEGGAGVA